MNLNSKPTQNTLKHKSTYKTFASSNLNVTYLWLSVIFGVKPKSPLKNTTIDIDFLYKSGFPHEELKDIE